MSTREPYADELTVKPTADGRAFMLHDKFGEFDGPYTEADAYRVIGERRKYETKCAEFARRRDATLRG